MAKQPLGSAVRTVKRRKESTLAAKPIDPPSSELLEKVDPAEVNKDVQFLGPVQSSKPTTAVAFARRHYRNGRHAADVVRAWVPYALVIAALCAAGFLEGLVLSTAAGLLGLVLLGFGFLSGLVSRWRQRNKPNMDAVAEEEGDDLTA